MKVFLSALPLLASCVAVSPGNVLLLASCVAVSPGNVLLLASCVAVAPGDVSIIIIYNMAFHMWYLFKNVGCILHCVVSADVSYRIREQNYWMSRHGTLHVCISVQLFRVPIFHNIEPTTNRLEKNTRKAIEILLKLTWEGTEYAGNWKQGSRNIARTFIYMFPYKD